MAFLVALRASVSLSDCASPVVAVRRLHRCLCFVGVGDSGKTESVEIGNFRVGDHTPGTEANLVPSRLSSEKMSNESPTRHRTIDARCIAWLICTVLSLLALTTLVVTDAITPQLFAMLCLFLMTGSGVILYRLLSTSVHASAPTNSNPSANRRKRWFVLAAGLLWLIFALWMTRSGPWLPRLVGTSFVLLLIAGNMARKPGV
jgi:hypothetical protein